MVKSITQLYANVVKNKPESPLFNTYSSEKLSDTEPTLKPNSLFASRLGHSGNKFSLADAQRDALIHLMASNNGDILAVNGPAGTGKTTLLLSVVASAWAKAAIEGGNPSVILAASTNNQAVTNVIDAFGKDFSTGEGVFSGRWLPDIKSFGAYFPSKKIEDLSFEKYQTRKFFGIVEDVTYVEKAELHYIELAKKAFPNLTEFNPVKLAVSELLALIKSEAESLVVIESSWTQLQSARTSLSKELGDNPAKELHRRMSDAKVLRSDLSSLDLFSDSWESYLAAESLLYSLFTWIPKIKYKRIIVARQFLKSYTNEKFDSIEAVSLDIAKKLTTTKLSLTKCEESIARGENTMRQASAHEAMWAKAIKPLQSALLLKEKLTDEELRQLKLPATEFTIKECDELADKTIRFNIFLLTTHYWEGRWLLEMNALIKECKGNLADERKKKGRAAIAKRWYRRMMLTPCVVSTFHMLPKEMKVSRKKGDSYDDYYLYDFADLLIVDEAGQVLPEVAGASFSLAKKAMVIGDTKQIEPIWSITKQIDVGNMVKEGILPYKYSEDSYEKLSELGKMASSGSVMLIAQNATRYHYDTDLARGMFLFEHRRCYTEIISYCDELCYRNKLILKRGFAEINELPAMGYLHIDGICQSNNGKSRRNELEAETIAAWLMENKGKLEDKYGKTLDKIVGVVTPFAGQKNTIIKACNAIGIPAGGKSGEMTVGTVHALQGAERDVVIFSPTYSKHSDGKFIDSSQSMLNVAVSRAKDNFLVFGDMDIFDSNQTHTPRGLLASYLFKNDSNKLNFKPLPRRDLKTIKAGFSHLVNSEEHDLFLVETLNNSKKDVHIVTPWLLPLGLQDAVKTAMTNAINRGVDIKVYTDERFNKEKNSHMIEAITVLEKIGVQTLIVKNVHSKNVMSDDYTYCVGSFNWFSAARTGIYKNYELSIVYRSEDMRKEIDVVKSDLQQRVVKHYDT